MFSILYSESAQSLEHFTVITARGLIDAPYESELQTFCQRFWNILSLFFSAHWLVSLPDLTESPLDMARKLLQGAITAARGLLNPQFDGLRIGQEDLKRDEEKKIAHP